jgi:hypothetical protein
MKENIEKANKVLKQESLLENNEAEENSDLGKQILSTSLKFKFFSKYIKMKF